LPHPTVAPVTRYIRKDILMPKAVFNDTVIADYDDIILLEGKYYFPPESVNMKHLRLSKTTTVCHWKGTATYYDVVVNKKVSRDAAWSYSAPSTAAMAIKDHVAFGEKVEILP
jgi:uncharacterized protein (DUF427 family)